MKPIRVLIVDDSALVRQILSQGLAKDPQIEVAGTAHDAYAARDLIVTKQPDVLTLDVEMPRMDGIEFLRRLMPQHPMRTIMVSSMTERGAKVTFDALAAGAIDFVTKPHGSQGLNAMISELCEKIKMAAKVDIHAKKYFHPAPQKMHSAIRDEPFPKSSHKIIAIGASTGGTEAIRKIVVQFPLTIPGIVVVQHMPPGFTKMFADRLNKECAIDIKEAENGDQIGPGQMLIAPGAKQMTVRREGENYRIVCQEAEKVNGHCPSVDVLFRSVAQHVGANAIGVILTGMGNDGAEGMSIMRKHGARTLGQDEKSSVVFGMPNEADKRGGVEHLISLDQMASAIFRALAPAHEPGRSEP
ncbi:MAG: chemotaxis response regulator protein-glutamate methylesterase [SAR324 cluster bacterium]|nr:chemotaxis response regulator protein-glutamate methylesterase [SAR324 cluster bacterium]